MKTLSSLKKDLGFNQDLSSLIEVLKSLAVSQFRILEQKIKSFEQLLLTIESFFELIDTAVCNHPFIRPSNQAIAVVAITSDSGLLGGLNKQVIQQAIMEFERGNGKLIVIGERGKNYVRESGIPFVAFSGIIDEERYAQAMQLRDYVLSKIMDGSFGIIKVVYPRPVSFTVQRIESITFLPFSPSVPYKTGALGGPMDIILESSLDDIIEYLIYIWVGQKFYEIFGLSRLAEFAARYIHLEESHQKLRELDKKTKLEYFRVRHELIDRNMRELFASRLIYAG